MGDINNRNAPFFQVADDVKQSVQFFFGQRGRGLVHQDDPAVAAERLGDLHHLLAGHGQGPDLGPGVRIKADAVEQLLRLPVDLLPVDPLESLREPAGENVLRNGKLIHQIELLENDADAMGGCNQRIGDIDFLPVDEDLSFVFLVVAVEDLHERRFARAVFPDQSPHLAFGDGEAHVVERLDARERLADMTHFKKSVVHCIVSFVTAAGCCPPGCCCI